MTAKPRAASGGFGLLDFVVLLAMAVTAAAFAVGLILNSGIEAIAAAIAAAALFMVMASSHFVITRSLRTASVSGRLDEMEDALVALDTDLQRIDQVEDDVARLELINDKVERLDTALADFEGGSELAGSARFERLSGEFERLQERMEVLRSEVETATRAQRQEIGSELKSLEEMIKAFARDLTAVPENPAAVAAAAPSAPSATSPMAAAMAASAAPLMTEALFREPERVPDSLMRRLEEEVFAEEPPVELGDTESEIEPIAAVLSEEPEEDFVVVMTEEVTLDLVEDKAEDEPPLREEATAFDLLPEENLVEDEPLALDPIGEDESGLDFREEETIFREIETVSLEAPAPEPEPEPEPEPFDLTVAKAAPFERAMTRAAGFEYPEEEAPFDPELLPVLRKAIEANRIELYLQPIVTLPDRRLHGCDAVARVRTDSGELVGADRYRRVAELAGLLPRIDNVMLVKSVQLLRRLGPDSKLKRVFCGLSAPSLLDRDFFPELVEFLEENSALGENLTFQLTQKAIADLGDGELNSLKTLGRLGFCFSLDRIAHLDLDFGALRDYFFRFVKLDVETLLNGLPKAHAPVAAADLAHHLDRFDLKLIVTKVEDESVIARLLDYGVDFAEGDLFGEPRPVSAEMYRELEAADAA